MLLSIDSGINIIFLFLLSLLLLLVINIYDQKLFDKNNTKEKVMQRVRRKIV